MERIILHVDLDMFFAACEIKRKHELKGKPVVIVMYTRNNNSGAVSTSSYKARALGIKSGMSLFQAKQLADNETIFLKSDIKYYKEVSARIMNLLRYFADKFEPLSIDEAFLDVSFSCNHSFENALILAKKIKKRILIEEKLDSSVGISFNKLLAKMATDSCKPNGIKLIKKENVSVFLDSLPVKRIPGVGFKTAEQLEKINIKTIAELKNLTAVKLIELFGKKKGLFLFNSSRGIDNSPIKELHEMQQISRIRTLEVDSNDFNTFSSFVENLLRNLFVETSIHNLSFKSISLTFVLTDLKVFTKSRTFDFFVNSFDFILPAVKTMLNEFLLEHNNSKIRRIGVSFKNLEKHGPQQSLFDF